MLKLIANSYKMFFKNFPVILLLSLPLLVLSGISTWIETTDSTNSGTLYFYYLSLVLVPVLSVATDIALYRRFFGYSIVNPFCSIKAFVFYLVAQLALGLAASAPIILFFHLMQALGASYPVAFISSIVLNILVGIYLLARFNILLPLIVQNKVPSLRQFSQYTARSYKEWLVVALLVYTPYVVLNYVIPCAILNVVLINLFAFVFLCFNFQYVSTFPVSTAKAAPTKKVEVKTVAEEPSKVEVKKEAKEEPAKPVAKKASTAKKAPAPKKEAAPKKAPTPKKETVAKKPAAPKKPKAKKE